MCTESLVFNTWQAILLVYSVGGLSNWRKAINRQTSEHYEIACKGSNGGTKKLETATYSIDSMGCTWETEAPGSGSDRDWRTAGRIC